MEIQQRKFMIDQIPAILWGPDSPKLFIAIHGDKSSKEDLLIVAFVAEAVKKGYLVLSFDLPGLGERLNEKEPQDVQVYIDELQQVINYGKTLSADISLFANSIGAYFSLLSYQQEVLRQAVFVSPIVDMQALIAKIMVWTNVTPTQLATAKLITTPIKELYWPYYEFVMNNPINNWPVPTEILATVADNLTTSAEITAFANKHQASLTLLEEGEHFFHTEEQFKILADWLAVKIN